MKKTRGPRNKPEATSWLTAEQVAATLNISLKTLACYEKRGLIKAIRLPSARTKGGRPTLRYDRKELARFQNRLREAA